MSKHFVESPIFDPKGFFFITKRYTLQTSNDQSIEARR